MFVHTRRFTRSMKIATTASVPVTIQQNAHPVVVQLENDVSSLIPETTHMDESIPIKENHEKSLAKRITEPSKFEVAPSCMDACGSGPEPSFISIPSPDQDVNLFLLV